MAKTKTDKITLKQAVTGPRVWEVVGAAEPARGINVSMTYAELHAVVRLFDMYKAERKERHTHDNG